MELYGLILVDDEDELRQGVLQRIDWAACGFQILGEAENGEAGLELAQNVRPDAVLTDIRMPFMDGLEMSRRILREAPDTKIIVISGFDDFEYCKQAISLGTADYLLKPVSAAELQETLLRLHARIDEEVRAKRDIERLRLHYEHSLPLLRSQFLCGLLQRHEDTDALLAQGAKYGVSLDAPCWTAALLHCDRGQEGTILPHPELIPLSLLEQATETLRPRFDCEVFFYGDGVAVLARLEDAHARILLMETMGHLCQSARRYLSLEVTAGVGGLVHCCREIPYAAQGAQRALEYRALLGTGRAILIDDIEPASTEAFLEEEQLRHLLGTVKFGDTEDVETLLSQLRTRLEGSQLPVLTQRLYAAQIVTELLRLMQSCHIEPERAFPMDSLLDSQLPVDDMWTQLSAFCRKLSRNIRSMRTDCARSLTERACDYIEQHFMETDLSVDHLCEMLYVSPSYFSTVFKRERGESFVRYLTRVRMEKAADLLRSTDDKTYLIAERVGYAEPNYFSYVFKKHHGVTPSKFRETVYREIPS